MRNFFLFHRRVARRRMSEQVVHVMDEQCDNDIPSDSDSDDDRPDIDNGETEADKVDQVNPMQRQPKGERRICAVLYIN